MKIGADAVVVVHIVVVQPAIVIDVRHVSVVVVEVDRRASPPTSAKTKATEHKHPAFRQYFPKVVFTTHLLFYTKYKKSIV